MLNFFSKVKDPTHLFSKILHFTTVSNNIHLFEVFKHFNRMILHQILNYIEISNLLC